MAEERAPLHPLLAREFKSAEARTEEQWREPKQMQILAHVVEKHADRQQLLVQLYATAHEMFDSGSIITASFYMGVVAIVLGDERIAREAASGALDAAAAAQALGKHVNREASGVKSALPGKSSAGGVGLRGQKKR